jgi:hypothetical protein
MDRDTKQLVDEWSKAIHQNWVANRVEPQIDDW